MVAVSMIHKINLVQYSDSMLIVGTLKVPNLICKMGMMTPSPHSITFMILSSQCLIQFLTHNVGCYPYCY